MFIIKSIFLILVFSISSIIGILFSKKYQNREKELKELKNAISLFETKIKFTYSPVPEVFKEVANGTAIPISKMFKIAGEKMEKISSTQAWEEGIAGVNHNLKEEDIKVIKEFGRMLGKTDMEGQISQIEVTKSFLEEQIEKAKTERNKNEKLYKTLGMVSGLAIVIILI